MLEVRFIIGTGELTGWCGDIEQFGNLEKRLGVEEIVVLDISVPEKTCAAYLYDEASGTLVDNPNYVPPAPSLSTHWARVESISLGEEKPIRVKRTWDGREYTVDCYVTETVKDQYQAGDIAVGDFVLVEFLEDSADKAIVIAKVYQTW